MDRITGSQAEAIYMQKKAAVSFNTLRSIAKKYKPLFHMVSDKNAPGFLKSLKIMSPAESKLRNLLRDFEGTLGTKRYAVTKELTNPASLIDSKAKVSLESVIRGIRRNYSTSNWPAINQELLADSYGKASIPGVVGAYNTSSLLHRLGINAGKNWDTISMSLGKPYRSYGNVGIMSGAKNIKYPMSSTDTKALMSGPMDYFVRGKPVSAKGLLSEIVLPQVKGTVVYDPKYVMENFGIAVARKLKAQGGIPLNARFYRKLKALNKQLSTYVPPDIEKGNMPWNRFVEKHPDFETTILPKAKEYVNAILGI